MKALNVPAAGQQPTISELPVPEVAAGTVLVKVDAAGLNPVDNAIAAAMMAGMLEHVYPLTLGRDAVGVVEKVGEGVGTVKVGDTVFGNILLMPPVQAGTLAEYALMPAASVAVKPAGLDDVTAAALPLAGAGALDAIRAIDVQPGQTVLVNGATGGVGQFAVQLLKLKGATVIATAGTAGSAQLIRDLGADEVLDRTAGPVAQQVLSTRPEGVDALVNLAGYTPDTVPFQAVRRGGRVATLTGAPDQATAEQAGLTVSNLMVAATTDKLDLLGELAAAGKLRVPVSKVIGFDQAADGLGAIAAGQSHGKVVVDMAR